MTGTGPLIGADESLTHQITDTFATVGQSDRSWTEKVWGSASAKDGSLQLGFGMGKYPNRNVLDAYAGVSRGTEQWTVRASRRLASDLEATTAGPIHYEVIEPLQAVRFRLEPNDIHPISFDWTFEGAVPAGLEDREVHRSRDGFRVDADVVRYHHIGTARGWVEVEGRRTELDGARWVAMRDHSWGVRYMVGAPEGDIEQTDMPPSLSSTTMWAPILMERPDGSRYGLFWYYQRHALGSWQRVKLQGAVEHPDGRRETFAGLVPELDVRDDNRRLLGGTLHFVTTDGSTRSVTIQVLGDTGFHLGPGLYFGWHGHWHGQWRGELHVEGEHIPDCSDPDTARELHQLRDCLVRVDDPVGGGTGVGVIQSIVSGPDSDRGLTEAASFI
jgi:hypothetical protein